MQEMASEGRTVFFSSHTLSEVDLLCKQVAIIRDGTIVAFEEIESLRKQAPRVVRITFDSAQSAEVADWPDFVRLHSRHQNCSVLHMDGPASELIEWSARQPITDIDISPPSLEAVFRRFYSDTPPGVTT
jgi:ABC-2 type transport system ATP-binding protein